MLSEDGAECLTEQTFHEYKSSVLPGKLIGYKFNISLEMCLSIVIVFVIYKTLPSGLGVDF